jgi:hypothetical protein
MYGSCQVNAQKLRKHPFRYEIASYWLKAREKINLFGVIPLYPERKLKSLAL